MKRKRLIYLGILLINIILISVMYVSYAFFTSKVEGSGKLNIVAGTLDYKIESSSLINNKITVGFNETKVIDIKLTSLNDVDSKYEIYYNYVTSLSVMEKGRINIGYTTTNKDNISGEIAANKSKNLRIYVTNSNDKDVEIVFGVKGGLVNDSLVINEGIRLTNNDIVAPDFDISTEVINGKTYATIDTYDNMSGIKSVEYNGQIQMLPKNRSDYKIYLLYASSVYSEEGVLQGLYKYKNVIPVTEFQSIDEIISNNYNMIIQYSTFWSVNADILVSAFNNGINIYSVGNDTSILPFISSYKYSNSTSLNDVFISSDNIFTRYAEFSYYTADDGHFFVKFNEDTNVWYQGTYDGVVYDALGYYRNNNTGWIHNQNLLSLGADKFGFIADYLLRINTAQFEINESGDYTFKVVDNAGNVVEKTVHIEVS